MGLRGPALIDRLYRWMWLSIVVALLGCGGQALENDSFHAAKGAVRGSAEELEALTKDVKVRKAAHDVVESMVEGADDGLRKAKIEQQVNVLVSTVFEVAKTQGNALVKSMIEEQGPLLESRVRSALSGSIHDAGGALKQAAKDDLGQATQSLVGYTVTGFADALDSEAVKRAEGGAVQVAGDATRSASAGLVSGFRDELGKKETVDALNAAARSVSAGVASGLRDELGQPATAEAVRNLAKAATVGAIQAAKEQDRGTWEPIAIGAGVLVALAVAALVFSIRRSMLTDQVLAAVAHQINAGDYGALKKAIHASASEKRVKDVLGEVLALEQRL